MSHSAAPYIAYLVCVSLAGLVVVQVASLRLLPLDCFEQRFEVARSEALVALSLYDLIEQSRPVLLRLGEYLQQVAAVVEVDQYGVLLQLVDALSDHQGRLTEPLPYIVVVRGGRVEELQPASLQLRQCVEDVVHTKGHVLHARTA